jgi:3-oxoacyl-[acyl-carrier-protein] synthase II
VFLAGARPDDGHALAEAGPRARAPGDGLQRTEAVDLVGARTVRDLGGRRRVAITGLGAVSALGATAPETWKAMRAGLCGIRPVTLFDTAGLVARSAAEIERVPAAPDLSRRLRKRVSRADLFVLAAAREAMEAAALDLAREDAARVGVVLGAGAGGMLETESYYFARLARGPRRARVSKAWGFFPSTTTDFLAAHLGAQGYSTTTMTACSSSTIAIGLAADAVRSGAADIVIAGGAEALCRLTFAGFVSLRAVDPDRCRPFDRERRGMSLGEGAGILVLEAMERARRRGAPVQAELLGWGAACDAHHVTAPDPSGDGAARTIREALADAGVLPEAVDYISAHGTGTPYNDESETRAIHAVFGPHARSLAVSSVKSMIGHCLGAAGALEAVALAQTIRDGWMPPTAGLVHPDPACDLDYVPNVARRGEVRIGLSSSFAFGGNNGAIVMGRA